jgi:hypothetical protein
MTKPCEHLQTLTWPHVPLLSGTPSWPTFSSAGTGCGPTQAGEGRRYHDSMYGLFSISRAVRRRTAFRKAESNSGQMRETQYFADPFEPPAWRARWVEPMT